MRLACVGTFLLAVACSPQPNVPASRGDASHVQTAANGSDSMRSVESLKDASTITAAENIPTTTKSHATVLLSSTSLMRDLEKAGFDLVDMVEPGRELAGVGGLLPSNHDFYAASARVRDLVKVVEDDIAAAKRKDPSSGVGLAFSHRLMDVRALSSKNARWELIGVSQRLDRLFVDPAKCGEIRFIYRLAYTASVPNRKGANASATVISSRLPATLAVSYWNSDAKGACSSVAKRWQFDARTATVASLTSEGGPLHRSSRGSLKAVETNIQIVRWPSTVRGDMAGYAEYAMHALVPAANQLVLGPLENTPNPVELRKRWPTWEKAFESLGDPHIAESVAEGMFLAPQDMLATTATSVTPHGFARLQNRPFGAVYRNAPSAVRRLDELSCQGCHASRSIAGFHFLGEEIAPKESVNAILVERSPHLLEDLKRREGLVTKLASASPEAIKDPARLLGAIPFPEHGPSELLGKKGEHCGLSVGPAADPTFAKWKCEAGLVCTKSPDPEMGTCEPSKDLHAGDACEVGAIVSNVDSHRDRVTKFERKSCPGVCESNPVGFPSGACAGECTNLAEDESCGAIPFLVGFNGCLGKTTPFEDCIRENARSASLQRCDTTRPCRDDYICARTSKGEGACMPPYFLFQLRVDGHPAL